MSIPAQTQPEKPKGSFIGGLAWWMTLIITVIAVPLFGAIMAMSVTSKALGQMLIFVIACWISTWLGMWLMKRANAHHWPHHKH